MLFLQQKIYIKSVLILNIRLWLKTQFWIQGPIKRNIKHILVLQIEIPFGFAFSQSSDILGHK